MNNIEQIIVRLKTRVALAELIGPDDVTVSVSDLSALIARLEAEQKETGVYAAISGDVGAIVTLLQGNEWAEHVAKTNVGGALEQEITRLINSITDLRDRAQTAEAALSAANEKLSKPVILSTSTVMSRACAVRAIKAAGFTAEGE